MIEIERTDIDTQTTPGVEFEALGKALVWLAFGALLGLAVALPYDRLLGLPDSTGTILGSVVWVILLGRTHAGRGWGAKELEDHLDRVRGETTLFHPGAPFLGGRGIGL
jgi:hypothetical protein